MKNNIYDYSQFQKYKEKAFAFFIASAFIFLIVDVSISNISTTINISESSYLVIFFALAIAFTIFGYFILKYTIENGKKITSNSMTFNILNRIAMLTHFILSANLLLISFQIISGSQYDISLLQIGSGIAYSLAGVMTLMLSIFFIKWYKLSKIYEILLYGLASIMIFASMILTFVFTAASLFEMPQVRNPLSEVVFLYEPTDSIMGILQYVWTYSNIVNFFLLWTSTTILLHNYSRKIGNVKFWIMISIPAASFLLTFLVITPLLFITPFEGPMALYINIIGYNVPGITSGILFGMPFLIVSRSIQENSSLKGQLFIAAAGLALFQVTTVANISHAPYPPLGFATVLSTGFTSFMILIGLYSSALSISADVKVRRFIHKSLSKEAKMMDSIGRAVIEEAVHGKIMKVLNDSPKELFEQANVEPFVIDNEIKQYLKVVRDEMEKSKGKAVDRSKDKEGG